MAELRTAENSLGAITQRYERVRCDGRLENRLPALVNGNHLPLHEKQETKYDNESRSSYRDLLVQLESIRKDLQDISPAMKRFEKRLNEKDPVSGQARYGEQTRIRVSQLLASYEELQRIVEMLLLEDGPMVESDPHSTLQNTDSSYENVDDIVKDPPSTSTLHVPSIIDFLRKKAEQERLESEAQERRRLQTLEEQEHLERLAREEKEQMELVRLRAQQEEEALRIRQEEQRREQDRRSRQNQEEAERRAEREWVNGITKGPDGVKQQLSILLESTRDDAEAQTSALRALHGIFAQICAHPEEVNFRKIRRKPIHPKFQQDIGRHDGGKEIFIAAGFELGEIEGVPCFVSKEPNLERDMDRWVVWFDRLKATLQILEEQLSKK